MYRNGSLFIKYDESPENIDIATITKNIKMLMKKGSWVKTVILQNKKNRIDAIMSAEKK